MQKIVDLARTAYARFASLASYAQNPLLLLIRLYWGWQFAQDGWGKLTHLDRVTQFFASLNLPAPGMTALMVAVVELAGGILLALGIASRLVSLVLFVNMTMAYLSVPDDRVNFSHILSNPSDFYGATPYTYWFAALLILVMGPGLFAVDSLIGRWFYRGTGGHPQRGLEKSLGPGPPAKSGSSPPCESCEVRYRACLLLQKEEEEEKRY
jgi:putative oxidoreductase